MGARSTGGGLGHEGGEVHAREGGVEFFGRGDVGRNCGFEIRGGESGGGCAQRGEGFIRGDRGLPVD